MIAFVHKKRKPYRMETKVLPVSDESLALAADLLRRGELVALPTETV